MIRTIAILLLCASSLSAVLIPTDRLGKWVPGVDVGVVGGIPTNRTTIIDASAPPYNADKTGATDTTSAIQSAINGTPVNGVTYLPAGTYKISHDLALGASRTLRGAGMNATRLLCTGGSNILSFGNQSPGWWGPLTNGITATGTTANSTTLTVADTSSFTVGLLAIFTRQASTNQFDSPVVVGTGGPGGDFFRQLTQITGKTATTLTVSPGPFIDMSTYPVKILAGVYTGQTGVGVEDLNVDLGGAAIFSGLSWTETQNSWLLRVKISNTHNYCMSILQCSHLEIRGCQFGPAAGTPSSNQAGVLFNSVDSTLLEDNIVVDEFPSLEMNTGTSGNVIAYNLFINNGGYYAIDSNHGPHNVMNLFEGNIIDPVYISDGYFGSESHATLFRNCITGINTAGTGLPNQINYTIALKRFARKYSIVGNIIGMYGYTYLGDTLSLGQPNIGNSDSSGFAPPWADWGVQNGPGSFQELDTGVLADLVRKGNYNYHNNAMESLGGDTLPNSLFLAAKPAYFGSLTWPPFNPASPGTPNHNQVLLKIPAGYRYLNNADPPPDTGGPTLGSAVIGTTGTSIVLSFSTAVDFLTGDLANWALSMSGGLVTLNSVSGNGTATITCGLSRTINGAETGTIAYTQPGNGVEDLSGNDLATLTSFGVTNNSTVGGPTPTPTPTPVPTPTPAGSLTTPNMNVNVFHIGPP